jgi:phage terminase large subunit-like protein
VPRSGAITLSDLIAENKSDLTVTCQPCGREGRYSVQRLIEKFGDMGLPDLLAEITEDCAKHQSIAIHDRCKAVYRW